MGIRAALYHIGVGDAARGLPRSPALLLPCAAMSVSPALPRRCLRLAALAALAGLGGCPGFGDRLPPDAGAADARSLADGALDGRGGADAEVTDASADDEVTDASADAEVVPGFETDVRPFLRRHCDDCHGPQPVSGAPYALTTLNECRSHLEAIGRRVLMRRDMPPGGGLVTDAERAMLAAWLDAGAPE